MRTLYLYGPPASGKTTLARRLAREFGRDAIDLDEEIVRRTGRTIPEIFASDGESAFRAIESETLRAVRAPIVALGGGTLLDPSNREWAESHGTVVVLDVDAETIARRVAAAAGTRPLGDKAKERAAHYASFRRHADAATRILLPRPLRGAVTPPVSKSHLHRLLIADFLAGGALWRECGEGECDDIRATRRCLAALAAARASDAVAVELDVGESGSTLRFLAPLAAALGLTAKFARRGRLAERPMIEYPSLASGVHRLAGNVSSQFVTGLLFALPLVEGDSEIVFDTPLESRGYVELTLSVLRRFGVRVTETPRGFAVPGGQRYVSPGAVEPERDWSAAAFWVAANALGSSLRIDGMDDASLQPDACVERLVARIVAAGADGEPAEIDVSGCPDLYPALATVAHVRGAGRVRFTGTARLRLKESDRIAAMERLFADPAEVDSMNDHRIAMAAAVLSTVADGPVLIHGADCVAKSYPGFYDEFRMDLYAVTGWPLAKTRSPEIHNAAHAAAGRKAEMVSYPAETIEETLRFASLCGVKGLAVTIPHKGAVMRHLDRIDPAAEAIGAVNTVVFGPDGSCGYNTDWDGFAEAVTAFAGRASFAGMRAVVFGAGGASKAVVYALRRLGAEVTVWHRDPTVPEADIYVNATPVDPVPDHVFRPSDLVYDLVYVPDDTALVVHARRDGCRAENGLSMLRAQAARQLALFAAGQ